MSDELVFAEEEPQKHQQNKEPWKILVADDEQAVHLVTRLALQDFTFEDRGLQLFSAYNEQQCREVMVQNPDMALILLDVVMDSVNSGFDVVKYIRENLGNKDVRIIMRTGQSGNAPEDRVIIDYDINDFKDKTELTVSKLRTTIISSLRALSHLKKLADSWSYLNQLVNTLPALMITLNHRGEVVLWNQTAQNWVGIPQESAQGKPIWTLSPGFEPLKRVIQECLDQRKPFEQAGVPFQARIPLQVNLALYPLSLGTEAQLIIRMDDATALLRQEQLINRTRRFEAMTELSEGFSREIARLTDLADRGLKTWQTEGTREGALGAFEELRQEGHRILSEYRTFLKKNEPDRSDVDLADLLAQTLRTLAVPTKIKVEFDSPFPKAPIWANVKDVEMAILKVANHALGGLAAGQGPNPTLRITLDRLIPDEKLRADHPEAEIRPYWVLKVADNGPVLSPEVLEHLLEPYFAAQGLRGDLGLSLVYKILLLHGGFVQVGGGDTNQVTLYWPEETTSQKRTPRPVQGSGTILVCDDEAMMRQLAASILQRFGFQVLQAADGYSAQELYRQNAQEIRLVLLDMLMPGMQGLDLFRALKVIDPKVKVLLSSGFGITEQVETALSEGCSGFLQKPYGFEKLGKKVMEILGA